MSKKKKSSGKYAAKRRRKAPLSKLVIVLVLVAVLLAACFALMLFFGPEKEAIPEAPDDQTTQTIPQAAEQPAPTDFVVIPEDSINLGYGIFVTDISNYTGMYMEDGTDEVLSNILMLVVENFGEQDIQYAKISMQIGEETANFTMTTLPVGAKMVLLEQNRMQWDETVDYSGIYPMMDNIAYFQEPISTMEDKLTIQIVDGALNIRNISGEDIPGTIAVYYKNAAADLYYGGITYRVSVEGGLKADELRQVMTNHASDTGSKIMFVTIGQ